FATPRELVAWMGALQAQEYLSCLWAVGIRLRAADEAAVEGAIADGSVVRIHALRGTWQLVAAEDARWLLDLVGQRVIAGAAGRNRELGLDAATLRRAVDLVVREAQGGRQLIRREIAALLGRAGIATGDDRLSHILAWGELVGALVSGGRRGKQLTYAAFDERVPRQAVRPRDQALAELALRFARARGPATARDFAWWSGLSLGDARAGLEGAGPALSRAT